MTDLDYMLAVTNDQMERIGYRDDLSVFYTEGHSYKGAEYDVAKPSYNCKLLYGDDLIAEVCYELDLNFSLGMTEERIARVEQKLDDRMIGLICTNGVIMLLSHKRRLNTVPHSIIKESNDRKFMSMN